MLAMAAAAATLWVSRTPTAPMLLHLTPLEMPVVWVAFAAGALVGAGAMLLWRRAPTRR
jgi:Na+-driven multidrug efflux pump